MKSIKIYLTKLKMFMNTMYTHSNLLKSKENQQIYNIVDLKYIHTYIHTYIHRYRYRYRYEE